MKIQYCSDLHLEFEQNARHIAINPLVTAGEILILAGDIVPLHDEFLSNEFFKIISENYRQVFWVPGNHEYYYRNITDYSSSFHIRIFKNIHLVNNVEINFEEIKFIFSTLWSKIEKGNQEQIEQCVADFRNITCNDKKFRSAEFNEVHSQCLDFIKKSLHSPNRRTVVVTHHLPSLLCNSPAHNSSPLNEAFCIDLTEYISSCKAKFWIYGHSHFNQKPLFIGETVMLTNQLGYVHLDENIDFRYNGYFSV